MTTVAVRERPSEGGAVTAPERLVAQLSDIERGAVRGLHGGWTVAHTDTLVVAERTRTEAPLHLYAQRLEGWLCTHPLDRVPPQLLGGQWTIRRLREVFGPPEWNQPAWDVRPVEWRFAVTMGQYGHTWDRLLLARAVAVMPEDAVVSLHYYGMTGDSLLALLGYGETVRFFVAGLRSITGPVRSVRRLDRRLRWRAIRLAT